LAATGELFETAERHAAGVMNGASLPVRPSPPPPSEPPVPEIERATIYALQNLKWTEAGQIMTAPIYSWADPPRALAELVLSRGLGGLPGSEHVKRVIESFGIRGGPADPDQCVDLDRIDAAAAEQPAEPRTPPEFIETVGTPRTVMIDAHRAG
jgi:hypothetical protein